MTRLSSRYVTMISVALLGMIVGSVCHAQTPEVAAPAITSAMAMRSVMLGVARAGERLVAVGERGFIIVSDDNGHSWRQVPSPASSTLVKVRFVDAEQGWAVGHAGVVLHTVDGGLHWVQQLDGVRAAQIELEQSQLEAQRSDSDAGRQLVDQARQLLEDGPDKPFLDLLFRDRDHGYIVGAYGLAFVTEDGGATWQSMRSRIDNPDGLHLYSIAQLGNNLFIAGEQGTLLRSTDQGQSFQALTPPSQGTLFGLQGSGGSLIAFGLRGKAFVTTDSGATFEPLDTLQPVTLTAGLGLADGTVLIADESGRVLRFTHGSATAAVLPIAEPGYFTGMALAANGDLVISTARGMVSSAAVVPSLERN